MVSNTSSRCHLSPGNGSAVTQPTGLRLPKLSTPIPHRLIAQDDTPFGHQLFDIAIAEAEAEVQLHP